MPIVKARLKNVIMIHISKTQLSKCSRQAYQSVKWLRNGRHKLFMFEAINHFRIIYLLFAKKSKVNWGPGFIILPRHFKWAHCFFSSIKFRHQLEIYNLSIFIKFVKNFSVRLIFLEKMIYVLVLIKYAVKRNLKINISVKFRHINTKYSPRNVNCVSAKS